MLPVGVGGHCTCRQPGPLVCSGGFGGGEAAALPRDWGKSVLQCFFLFYLLSVCVMGKCGWWKRRRRIGNDRETVWDGV